MLMLGKILAWLRALIIMLIKATCHTTSWASCLRSFWYKSVGELEAGVPATIAAAEMRPASGVLASKTRHRSTWALLWFFKLSFMQTTMLRRSYRICLLIPMRLWPWASWMVVGLWLDRSHRTLASACHCSFDTSHASDKKVVRIKTFVSTNSRVWKPCTRKTNNGRTEHEIE